jgi:hypothetical protein
MFSPTSPHVFLAWCWSTRAVIPLPSRVLWKCIAQPPAHLFSWSLHCVILWDTPALKSRSGVLLGLVERISCLRMIRCDVSADWLGLVMVQKIACRAMHFTWSHYQFSLSSCPQACLISLMATFHYTIYSFSMKNLKLIIRESSIFYSILCETHEFEKKDYAGLWCIRILFCQ